MKKKEIKGYLTLSIATILVLSACSTKPTVKPPVPTAPPVESVNPNDISIPGFDTPTTDPGTVAVDPNATTPTTDPGTVAVDPNATTPTTDPGTATVAPTATTSVTAVPTATATTTTEVTPTPTATVTATATATAVPTATPTATATATIAPTPTATPLPTAVPDARGNEQRATLAEGKLFQPRALDIRNGRLYVSAYDNGAGAFNIAEGHIKILDSSGNVLKTIEGGNADGLPRELNGVASDGSRVWTINRIPYAQSQNNTYSFSTEGTGRLNNRLGLSGDAGTNFQDMAIDPTSNSIYVASAGTQSVIKVNYDAGAIKADTQQLYFTGATKILPAGIAVDNAGNLFVTNAATSPATILRFGKNGTKAQEFNSNGKNGTGPNVSAIDDIAFDQNNGGIIYVLGLVNGSWEILRYDNEGNYIRSFGRGAMSKPESIAIATDGTVYVADYDKGSVLQFSPGK